MKKYLLFILAFICLSFSAQAAEAIDVNIRGNGTEITVSGTVASDSKVSVFVSKTVKATEYRDVVFADEVMCDKAGDFSVVFNMPDKFIQDYDATGPYTVYIAAEGFEKRSEPLEYVSLKNQNNLLKTLNEKKTSAEIKALVLADANENSFKSMGINIDGYKKHTELQNDIAEIVFNSKPYASISDLKTKYNDAFAIALINNATSVNELSAELKNGGYINFNIDGMDISKDADTFEFVLDYLIKHKKYNNMSETEKAMKDGVVVYELRNANKVSLTDVVKKYATYMGVKTNTKYSSYENNVTMQTIVNEQTILNLPATGVDSIAVFVDKFTAQLEAYKTPSGGNQGGGSGSSGGAIVAGIPSSWKPQKDSVNGGSGNNSQSPGTDLFSDMENFEWAKEAVEYLHKEGIVQGTGDAKFSPQDNITREQFTKMVVEFSGLKGDTDFMFDDVLPDAWYCDYIKTAYSTGIIRGISNNIFGTGNSMTREDAVVVIARCMDIIGITADDMREYSIFSDENEIADYAKDSVETLYKKGIINGMEDGVFAPKAIVTRAQAAKMIYELCKIGEK